MWTMRVRISFALPTTMKPVTLLNETRKPGAPVDWDDSLGPCDALSINDSAWGDPEATHNIMTSAWQPSKEELEILNSGGHVFLGIHGVTHPVVHLYAG